MLRIANVIDRIVERGPWAANFALPKFWRGAPYGSL